MKAFAASLLSRSQARMVGSFSNRGKTIATKYAGYRSPGRAGRCSTRLRKADVGNGAGDSCRGVPRLKPRRDKSVPFGLRANGLECSREIFPIQAEPGGNIDGGFREDRACGRTVRRCRSDDKNLLSIEGRRHRRELFAADLCDARDRIVPRFVVDNLTPPRAEMRCAQGGFNVCGTHHLLPCSSSA